ncbi:hypothetical protein [Streptomyces sp. R33]|uniref:Uncharacterized protein n=1 Tax=Streptomyces sp. R33 TaxID=3238629 RepID=A0AB39YFQ3_9ACTN
MDNIEEPVTGGTNVGMSPGRLRVTATGVALLMSLSTIYGAEAAVAQQSAKRAAAAQKPAAVTAAADISSARVAARL